MIFFFFFFNLVRFSERNGDIGKGRLEVYHAQEGKYLPACIDQSKSSSLAAFEQKVCEKLGYK